MNALLFYLVQSSFCLGMLFLVYWLFLRRDTFFQRNRFFLIVAGIFSVVLPAIPFKWEMQGLASNFMVFLNPVLVTPERLNETVTFHFQWFDYLRVIYFAGMFIFIIRFLVKIFQLLSLVHRSSVKRTKGYRLVEVDSKYSPFSFFKLVFLNEHGIAPENLEAILVHEHIHIRQAHTFDLLLCELLVIIQWFNPFAWLLTRELKNIHEYLADEGVISHCIPATDYQQLILNEAIGIQVNNLANNFSISQLKKRIAMMTKPKSKPWAKSKLLIVLPVLLVLGFILSASSYSNFKPLNINGNRVFAQPEIVPDPGFFMQEKPKQEQPAKILQTTPGHTVYNEVDKMPSYKGGDEAMVKFLIDNIKYPEVAMKNNIQGKVFVTFIVRADGSITDVKCLRGIGSGCDEEAIRVVKLMPKWNHGEQKGKPVDVQFNLPIRFALDSHIKDEPKK